MRGCAWLIALAALLAGCIVAPLRTAESLDVTVVDAGSGAPLPGAQVLYLACDVHDSRCAQGKLVRTVTDARGRVNIERTSEWGLWALAPGGMPAPDHVIAIWDPSHSAFVFSQYERSLEQRRSRIQRRDILDALDAIPADRGSSSVEGNSVQQLQGGVVRLKPRG